MGSNSAMWRFCAKFDANPPDVAGIFHQENRRKKKFCFMLVADLKHTKKNKKGSNFIWNR